MGKLKKPGPPAVAYSYVRFSTPEQAKGDSLRRQSEAAADWCRRNGVTLDTSVTFRDLGKSAFLGEHRRNPDRNALAAFLKLVETGRVPRGSVLIVESLDRLTREHIRPALTLVLNLIDAGVRIVQLSPVEAVYSEEVEPMELMLAIMELSRGHSESKRRSDLVGPAWIAKREAARAGRPQPGRTGSPVAGTMILTHRLPGWVRVRDGKPELIPERAKVVKRVFELAAAGYGRTLTAKRFNREKVPAFGKSNGWYGTTIGYLLKDRRAVGEYQPRHRDGRPAGDPIPNYFPPVVTESEWLAARAGAGERKVHRGRCGRRVNIFAGLLRDAATGSAFHVRLNLPRGGHGRRREVLMNTAGVGGKEPIVSFPYPTLEAAVLSALREIDPRDVLPAGDGGPDEVVALSAELAGIESELADAVKYMESRGFSVAIGNRVTALEGRKRETAERLADARARAVCPAAEAFGELKTLADVLASAPDPNDVRLRLRSALRRIVESILILIVGRGNVRLATAQINFRGTAAHRLVFVAHKHPFKGRNGTAPGRWFARTVRHPDDGLPFSRFDLRNRDLTVDEHGRDWGGVNEAVASLEAFPPDLLDALLRSGRPVA